MCTFFAHFAGADNFGPKECPALSRARDRVPLLPDTDEMERESGKRRKYDGSRKMMMGKGEKV